MSVDVVRAVLGWCTIINYGVLVWWFLIFRLAHDWIYRLHRQWFPMPVEQFNTIHYAAMAIYKIEVLLFNLVPYVALLIVGRRAKKHSRS
jgi:hypothetical protein